MVCQIGGLLLMKNKLYKYKDTIVRVLKESDQSVFIIDCLKTKMPYTVHKMDFKDAILCDEDLLMQETNEPVFDISEASERNKKIAYERYNMIAPLLSFMDNKYKRTSLINQIYEERNISKQTLRNYFCKYLIYQNICVLAPKSNITEKSLTQDEKNMRWALNKYFYSTNRYSLKSSYLFMLKEKYCDINGKLQSNIPSFYQFRYFYRKTKNMQAFYISRDGLSNYQRNKRPLLGDGVQEFAPAVGTGLLDSTVCDIYLIDETNSLVGRPILTVCIDAYSSFCYGYALTWEGGIYSLKVLMQNMVSNKKKHCEELGIFINDDQWNISEIPGTFVTDMGKEYVSENFEQITELGVTLKNLPPYRPELKGVVEKFFNIIQETYKPYLKNKGIVEPDFLERGVHDYRKDACLTIEDFEKIIVRCNILFRYQYTIKNATINEEFYKWIYDHSCGNISIVISLLHDAQEIAIMSGVSKININILNEAYQNRIEMYHKFIQPSINKVDKKKNKHIISDRTNNITQDCVIKEFNNIETILKISKEKNIDFIKLLKQSIIVEEIKI